MTLAKVLCNWPCSFWCAFCASDRDVRSKTEIDPSPKWRPQIQLTLWVLFVLETNKAITWNANAACHLTVSEPHTMSILALTSPSLLFDAGSVLVMSPSWGLLGLQLGSFYWHAQPNPTPSSSFYLSGKWSRFCSLIKFIVCDGSWLTELCSILLRHLVWNTSSLWLIDCLLWSVLWCWSQIQTEGETIAGIRKSSFCFAIFRCFTDCLRARKRKWKFMQCKRTNSTCYIFRRPQYVDRGM